MTEEAVKITGAEHAARVADVKRIERFEIFEVLAADLLRLEEAASDERDAMSWGTFALGTAVTVGVSWIAATSLTSNALAVHVGILAASVVLTLYFAGQAYKKRFIRMDASARARSGGRTVEAVSAAAASPPEPSK